jgi:hypothetical protein
LGDDCWCWRRLTVGGGGHASGVLLCCLLAGLLRRDFGGIEWKIGVWWRTRFRVKPAVKCCWLAGWLERKQASSGEWKATRAEVLRGGATSNPAAMK